MDIAQGTWGDMGRQQCYLVLIEYLQGPPWYVPAIFVAPSNGATQSTIDTARANSPPTRLLAPPYGMYYIFKDFIIKLE